MTLDSLLGDVRSPGGRPRVAITFDDAYSGALGTGVTELVRRGLPATIFVCPEFIGGRSFWWDALSPTGGAALLVSLREIALTDWQGRDSIVRANAAARGHPIREVPPYARAGTEEELRGAASAPGIVLGSHTWSHPNLTRLTDSELAGELERPLAWLRERFQSVSPWLSYPYGLADKRVAAATSAAGYRGGLLVEGGWLSPVSLDRFQLPRLNIPAGLSLNGFVIQTAGLLHH